MFLIRATVLVLDSKHFLWVVAVTWSHSILLLLIDVLLMSCLASGRCEFLYWPDFGGSHLVKREVEWGVLFRRHCLLFFVWLHRLIRQLFSLLLLLVWSLFTEAYNVNFFILLDIACYFSLAHAWEDLTATRFERILMSAHLSIHVSLWSFSVIHRIVNATILLVVVRLQVISCNLYEPLELCPSSIQLWKDHLLRLTVHMLSWVSPVVYLRSADGFSAHRQNLLNIFEGAILGFYGSRRHSLAGNYFQMEGRFSHGWIRILFILTVDNYFLVQYYPLQIVFILYTPYQSCHPLVWLFMQL